jgi:hypothetical protein
MKETFLSGLAIAYAGGGFICFIAYYPTIRDLYFREKASANTATYGLWTLTSFITFLYSLFILTDRLFSIMSFLNLTACLFVLILSIRLRSSPRPPSASRIDPRKGE